MDTIFIQGLAIDTIIGIYDWERETRQTVLIDIEMGADISVAAGSEDIADTPSYKEVAERIQAFVAGSQFFLIEAMAEQIAAIVRREFSRPWVKVTVHKPGAVPAARDVGVTIERGRREGLG